MWAWQAAAQPSPEMQELLKRKYDIQAQQAQAAQTAASAEEARARASTSSGSRSTAHQSYVIPQGDALEGTNAKKCKQANGSTISVSGGFRSARKNEACK